MKSHTRHLPQDSAVDWVALFVCIFLLVFFCYRLFEWIKSMGLAMLPTTARIVCGGATTIALAPPQIDCAVVSAKKTGQRKTVWWMRRKCRSTRNYKLVYQLFFFRLKTIWLQSLWKGQFLFFLIGLEWLIYFSQCLHFIVFLFPVLRNIEKETDDPVEPNCWWTSGGRWWIRFQEWNLSRKECFLWFP